ncbi:ABC transporter permease [Nocardioides sp. LHD-245]|uniref:ABC transporter permease n=1 Tax=Nocardioides sp. LHD-245 TaxID=3051387 RepID=UPI0027DF2FBE|nr:ABC transporter permease [Nocardioides sp. LHD-245]
MSESLSSATQPAEEVAPARHAERRAGRIGLDLLDRWAGPLLLVAMIVAFTIASPGVFLTSSNLLAVVNNQTITAVVALGLLFPLAAGVFDISIGGVLTLSVITSAWTFQQTAGSMPVPLAILITLAVGASAGLVNALLVVRLSIDPFIVTLGSGSIFLGISQLVANGQVVSRDIPTAFTDLGRGELFGIPNPIVLVVVLALIVFYVLEMTPLGRMIYATGFGREQSRLAGVPTHRILVLAFVVSGFCASLAGLVYTSRIGTGQPDVGAQYLLPSYAAAFLGSTMIKPGRFNVPGLLVGLAILAIGINGLQLQGIPFWVISTFQGGALILAVVLTKLRKLSVRADG